MAQELMLISKDRYDNFMKLLNQKNEPCHDKHLDNSVDKDANQTNNLNNDTLNQEAEKEHDTEKKEMELDNGTKHKNSEQTGGLFVVHKGRRDILPGTKKKTLSWIKY